MSCNEKGCGIPRRARGWWAAAVAVGAVFAAAFLQGCATSEGPSGKLISVSFPVWFATPTGPEQFDVPVDMGMVLPAHLAALGEQYALPGWVVYGVVRCLGAEELEATGTLKTFIVRDERGESRAVVEDVHYDVPAARIHAALRQIADACLAVENEVDRQVVLGAYVKYRCGAYVLFSLAARPASGDERRGDSPLMATGEWKGETVRFEGGLSEELPRIGWREEGGDMVVTQVGQFRYLDPVGSFRKTEEDAIYELAKSVLVKLSHLEKTYNDGANDDVAEPEQTKEKKNRHVRTVTEGQYSEETVREEVFVGMRGVRIVSRVVDVDHGLCLVEVRVAKGGVRSGM